MGRTRSSRPGSILFVSWLFVCVGFPLPSEAQTYVYQTRERVTAEGEGEAEIQGQDLNRARQEALEDALQDAFEKALFEVLPAGLSLAEHQTLLEALAPKRNEYLLQFRILAEMPALQVFFMTVEATFSNTRIQEELEKRGLSSLEGAEKDPVMLDVSLHGVVSFDLYQDLLHLVPKRIAGIESIHPIEVYADSLVVRVAYRGDVGELESAVREWLLERERKPQDAYEEAKEIEVIVSPVPQEMDESGAPREEESGSPEGEAMSPGTP